MVEARFTPQEQAQYFDLVVLSNRIKTAKPDPAIYRWVCDQLGMAPENILVIDDVAANCEAAQAIGMPTIQYRNREQVLAVIQAYLNADQPPGAVATIDPIVT
jgi:putative hydrolase of the HAD superfamily